MLGRNFTPEEEKPNGPNAAVIIPHGLWQRAFGGQANIIGRTDVMKMVLDGRSWRRPRRPRRLRVDAGDVYVALRSERDRSGDVCAGRRVARSRRPPGMLRPGAAGDAG